MSARCRSFCLSSAALACIGIALALSEPSLALPSSAMPAACAVPAPTVETPGSPPPFVPSGGRVEVVPTLTGQLCGSFRLDGTLAARAFSDQQGRIYRIEYFAADGALSLADDLDYYGLGTTGSVQRLPGAEVVGGDSVDASCGVDERNPYSQEWQQTNHWWFVAGSAPDYLNVNSTETNLRNAHIEWETNDSWCTGIGDSSSINFTYDGRKSTSFGQNGYSTVGFGDTCDLGHCGTIGWTRTWYAPRSAAPIESDTRLDQDPGAVRWENGDNYLSRWDVWHVYAHELGHTAQFGHVGSASNVMFSDFTNDADEINNRKLGRGDALANNAKY